MERGRGGQKVFAGCEAASLLPVPLYFPFSVTSQDLRAVCEAEMPAMLQITWRPVSEHPFSLCGSPSLPSHPFDVKRAGVSSASRSRSRPVASVVHLSLSGVFGEGEELRGVEK